MNLLAFSNNAIAITLEEIEADGTTLVLAPGQGDRFPALSSGYYFIGTFSDASQTIFEIVWVVARTGDVLTLERGKEGTTALPWPAHSRFENRWTKGSINAFPQVPVAQSGSLNYSDDSGSAANAYVAALDPEIVAPRPDGLPVRVNIAHTNTGASTLNDGAGTLPIVRRDGSPLIGGELIAGSVSEFLYDGFSYQWQGLAPTTLDAIAAGQDRYSAVTPKLLKWENLAAAAALSPDDLLAFQQSEDKLARSTLGDVISYIQTILDFIPQITLAGLASLVIPTGINALQAVGRAAPGDGGETPLVYYGMSPPVGDKPYWVSANGRYFVPFGPQLNLQCFTDGVGEHVITTVQAITQANPAVVTSTANGCETGDRVLMQVFGMTQLNTPYDLHAVNPAFTVIKLTDDTFSLNLDNALSGTGNSYNSSTGVLTLNVKYTMRLPPSVGAPVVLSGLAGTGAFAALNGTWNLISTTGRTIVVQGPVGAGAATVSSGNAQWGVDSTSFGAFTQGSADWGWRGTNATQAMFTWLKGAVALGVMAWAPPGNYLIPDQNVIFLIEASGLTIKGVKGLTRFVDQGSNPSQSCIRIGSTTTGVNIKYPADTGVTTTAFVGAESSRVLPVSDTSQFKQDDYIAILDLSQNIPYRGGAILGITNITQSYPAVVTVNAAYDFEEGDTVPITGVSGMVQINGNYWTMLYAVDSRSFAIDVDSTSFSAYARGGQAGNGGLAAHQGQYSRIQSIDSPTQITLGAPLLFDFYAGSQVGVWNNPIRNVLIDGITFEGDPVYKAWSPGITPTLRLNSVVDSVMSNCTFLNEPSRAVTVEDCLFNIMLGNQFKAVPELPSNSYGVEGQTGYLLIANNIQNGGQHIIQSGGTKVSKVATMFVKMFGNVINGNNGAGYDTHWASYAHDYSDTMFTGMALSYPEGPYGAAITLRGYGMMNAQRNSIKGCAVGVRAHQGGGLTGGVVSDNYIEGARYSLYANNFDQLRVHDNDSINATVSHYYLQYGAGPAQGLPLNSGMSFRRLNTYGDQAVPAVSLYTAQNNPLDRTLWDWAEMNTGSMPWVGTGTAASIINYIKPSGSPEVGLQSYGPYYPVTVNAATLVLNTSPKVNVQANGNYSAGVTAITMDANSVRVVQFTGAVLLVHSPALFLPFDGGNYTTSPGDTVYFANDGSGNVRALYVTPTLGYVFTAKRSAYPAAPTSGIVEYADTTSRKWIIDSSARVRGRLSNNQRYWSADAIENANTLSLAGVGGITSIGTLTAVALSALNFYAAQRRLNIVSASTVNTNVGLYLNNSIFLNWSQRITWRWGIGQFQPGASFFCGLKLPAQLGTTNPAQLLNALGVGISGGLPFQTTYKIYCNDNAGTATPIDTGFPTPMGTITSGTYDSTTGLITLTMGATLDPLPVTNVALSTLAGTGAYASLVGTWPVVSASGTTLVLQASTGLGAATLTSGNAAWGSSDTYEMSVWMDSNPSVIWYQVTRFKTDGSVSVFKGTIVSDLPQQSVALALGVFANTRSQSQPITLSFENALAEGL